MNYFLSAALLPIVTAVSYWGTLLFYISQIPTKLQNLPGLADLIIGPTPVPRHPTLSPRDVSVILPTVEPENADFRECVQSCLLNYPGEIIVVTAGHNMAVRTRQIIAPYQTAFPGTRIRVYHANVANKRIQVAEGVRHARGKITILVDDHVFWPSANFLAIVLAPFEDDKVGAVGTNKRVRRTVPGFNSRSFWNMIGALYLERHNFEIRATNAIDGGVFVISGRTAAYRSSILQQPGFMAAFTNETFFFGKFGPLNADDDNFLTRSVVALGYDIKIQYCQDALIETTLGASPKKFLSQCLRWARTTWRSNSASLFTDRTVWFRQPWCVYAVYWTSFVNFALFYDAALVYTLSHIADKLALYALIAWIFVTKMVKLIPYFLREPQDLLMLPGYFVFAYFHSLIKLYAGLTFWVTSWSGRNLDAISNDLGDHDSDDSSDNDDGSDHDGDDQASPSSMSSNGGQSSGFSTSLGGRQGCVQTPWGSVRCSQNSGFLQPANVLDTQYIGPRRRPNNQGAVLMSNTPLHPTDVPTSTFANSGPYPDIDNPGWGSDSPPSLTLSVATTPSSSQLFTPTAHVVEPSTWKPVLPTPFSPPRLPPQHHRFGPFTPIAKSTAAIVAAAAAATTAVPQQLTKSVPELLAKERRALGLSVPTGPHSRTWTRGRQCGYLHSDADGLLRTRSRRCELPDLFDAEQN